MFTVTPRPAGDHWLAPLEADGVTFPSAWEGAVLGSVSWDVGPAVHIEGEPGRIPDSTQGFLHLSARDGQAVVEGELPEDWSIQRRDSTLGAFLANVTSLDGAGRQALVTAAQWIHTPTGQSLPSTAAAGEVGFAAAPGSGHPGFSTLQAFALPQRPSFASKLGDATTWTEVHSSDGYRQALVDGYAVNAYLPTLVAVWDLPAATVEMHADEEDWTTVWVLSRAHDEATALDLHNASLEGAGWHGKAEWRVFHEPSAPFEPGQVGCPSSS